MANGTPLPSARMEQDDGAGWRREGRYLLELIGITAVAVAQPVLDVIQQAPEELVNRQAGAAEIVVFALLVVLGPAVVFWLLEQPFRLVSARSRRWVHVGFVGFWVGVFVVEVVKSALGADPHRWLWLVGLAAAVGATVILWRSTIARTVLAYLALAAPVFLGLFLFASPVADLVLTGTVDPADVAIEDPAPVVLIAFDELPVMSLLDGDGHIDADAFPAFADLADESNWYRNNTGVSPVTPSALPAILTGQLPTETFPAPVATNFNESIFTLLGGTYDVDAVETLTRVCPTTICEAEAEPSSASTLRSLVTLSRTVFEGVARPTTAAADFEFVLERNPADPEAAAPLPDLHRRRRRRRGRDPGRRSLPPAASALGLPGLGSDLRGPGPTAVGGVRRLVQRDHGPGRPSAPPGPAPVHRCPPRRRPRRAPGLGPLRGRPGDRDRRPRRGLRRRRLAAGPVPRATTPRSCGPRCS